MITRVQLKTGNRRADPPDFVWIPDHLITDSTSYRSDAVVFERLEWGNAYGFVDAISEDNVRPTRY